MGRVNTEGAYVAKVAKKRSVVLDGEEQKQYENLGKAGICFSPDSRRLAYVAMVGKKKWSVNNALVVDSWGPVSDRTDSQADY